MTEYQILPDFCNAQNLHSQSIQADQNATEGKQPNKSILLLHKKGSEMHQKAQSRQKQGAKQACG